MKASTYNTPWLHWIVDDFLDRDTLAEVKSVEHTVEQAKPGRRYDSKRLFITDDHEKQYPNLHHLYRSLHNGAYKTFFEYYTGVTFSISSAQEEIQPPYILGGRYDSLIKALGGEDAAAVGWAANMDALTSMSISATD